MATPGTTLTVWTLWHRDLTTRYSSYSNMSESTTHIWPGRVHSRSTASTLMGQLADPPARLAPSGGGSAGPAISVTSSGRSVMANILVLIASNSGLVVSTSGSARSAARPLERTWHSKQQLKQRQLKTAESHQVRPMIKTRAEMTASLRSSRPMTRWQTAVTRD